MLPWRGQANHVLDEHIGRRHNRLICEGLIEHHRQPHSRSIQPLPPVLVQPGTVSAGRPRSPDSSIPASQGGGADATTERSRRSRRLTSAP